MWFYRNILNAVPYWIRVVCVVFLVVYFGFPLSRACNRATKGFRLQDVCLSFPFDPQWEVDVPLSLEEERNVFHLLKQPFRFLASGGTSDVFLSEDGQYVLKFFKRYRLVPPFWIHWQWVQDLDPSIPAAIIARKEKQKSLQFTSYKLAAGSLKHQTGVLYLHLNPTTHIKQKIVLYDNIGVRHELIADRTAFALQKKVDRFAPYFKGLLTQNDRNKARDLLSQFAVILKERAQKGIRDGDITPGCNIGVLEGKLVMFDIDQMRYVQNPTQEKNLMLRDACHMMEWLQRRGETELATFLQEEIESL